MMSSGRYPCCVPRANETERALATKVNEAVCRCDDFHSLKEVPTLYIDALHHTIRSVVACYGEFYHRVTISDALDYAQHNGDAVPARTSTSQAGRTVKLL